MSRYMDPEMLEPAPPSFCSKFLKYTWKTITCLFSHLILISMVVSYCLFGAYAFESLERGNELEIKKTITKIRHNVTDSLWKLTSQESLILKEDNFTASAKVYLKDFENALLKAMTKDGWDGNEEEKDIQWTFHGALFYSIIVITTIGYGHITPRTQWGKVVTIFYAILGIPLMLLCLSNIGDIMATSFRFLYWKVCCYVCTRKRRKPRRTRSRGTVRSGGHRFSNRSRSSFRRSVRTSTRSADSGFGLSELAPSSYSDTDLSRYQDYYPPAPARGGSMPRIKALPQPRNAENSIQSRKIHPRQQPRGGSLEGKRSPRTTDAPTDPILLDNAPVLCNKYVVDQHEAIANNVPGIVSRNRRYYERRSESPEIDERRSRSMPRTQYLQPPRTRSRSPSPRVESTSHRAKKTPQHAPSPRIMSPMGFGSRQRYVEEYDSDNDYYEDDFYEGERVRMKPVPIWLCVFLVVSYIFAGAFLFSEWEKWDYLDSAYFCFITLTTIGFGDFVPAANTKASPRANVGIALCSLYLLIGISLLAMSFNLVQEEVIANVKSVAKTLGIIKRNEDEEEED